MRKQLNAQAARVFLRKQAYEGDAEGQPAQHAAGELLRLLAKGVACGNRETAGGAAVSLGVDAICLWERL